MLKLGFVVFALLQTSFSVPPPIPEVASTAAAEPPLGNSLPEQFLKLLPLDEMKNLSQIHAVSDQGFQAALLYFKNPEWEKIVSDLRNNPEWVAYKEFLKTAGLDLEPIIQHISHCLLAAENVSSAQLETVLPSLTNYMNDMKTNFAVQFIKAAKQFVDQIEQDENSKKTMEAIRSPKSKELFDKVLVQPAWKTLITKLGEMGIDVDNLVNTLYAFCGWKGNENATTASPLPSPA